MKLSQIEKAFLLEVTVSISCESFLIFTKWYPQYVISLHLLQVYTFFILLSSYIFNETDYCAHTNPLIVNVHVLKRNYC